MISILNEYVKRMANEEKNIIRYYMISGVSPLNLNNGKTIMVIFSIYSIFIIDMPQYSLIMMLIIIYSFNQMNRFKIICETDVDYLKCLIESGYNEKLYSVCVDEKEENIEECLNFDIDFKLNNQKDLFFLQS